jgi:signal transduction histidine kinase
VHRSRPSGAWATALKARLTRRVGFWRALAEVSVAGVSLTLVGYLIGPVIGSPWTELISYLSLAIYCLVAWRLSPGTGNLFLRAGRVLAFGPLMGLFVWLAAWICLSLGLHTGSFFGVNMAEMRPPPGLLLVSALLFTCGPFILTRTFLALWHLGAVRLRWRLTYSYLVVTVLAFFVLILAQQLLIVVLSLAEAPTLLDPSTAAQRAAATLAPLVREKAPPDSLASTMRGLLDGSARVPLAAGEPGDFGAQPPAFAGVRRLTLLSPDGTVIAAAGDGAYASGAPLPASQSTRMAGVLAQARGGGCANGRPANGPRADTAVCAIAGAGAAPAALVLVESNVDSLTQFQADFQRILATVLMAVSAAIYLQFVAVGGILLVAVGLGYLLSRSLTRRLERLARATGGLAAGDLSRRVEVDSRDEIGRLSSDFNAMASRLEEREAALTAEKERAERLLQANRSLVANVSHELRTPLATLRGYIEALEQDYGDRLPAHDMGVIQGEIGRLTGLIEDLFTLARAEAQQLPLNIEEVDARSLVGHLAETMAPLAKRERQIEIVTALPPDLPPVRADRVRLEQVMLNLLQNALRYTLPGGIIALHGAADDGVVTLAVDDTGVGIPPEELPLVFEKFYRSDSSRARESGGAGIGLALVKELVGAMDGSVAVQSTPGRGSRFTVALRQAM